MKNIKDELQNIILRDGQDGETSQLKKIQNFLRRHAEASVFSKEHQQFKSEETAAILVYARENKLFYAPLINEEDFLGEGAEQKVYRFDDKSVLKTNGGIFYECWLDYFNSLLIHNFFFRATAYTFLGFKLIDEQLHTVVKQEFVVVTQPTDLDVVKAFLSFNGFSNSRYNDYINLELGLIFEDLHDENVLSNEGILFFIDTVFYLTPDFFLKKE